jgi:hypothetical protein
LCQRARGGPFVPLGSRLDRLVRWVIDDGGLPAVDPLTRPYRISAVRRAVSEQDTTQLSPAGRSSLRRLAAELALAEDSSFAIAEAGASGYRNGRRETFRAGEGSGAGALGGLYAALIRGPFLAVVNPAFENRLREDPEYTGKTDRSIAGRMQEAYLAVTSERADLLYGRLARNWGPDLFDGLLLSPSVYPHDAIAGSLRLDRFELTALAQRLNDVSTGADTARIPQQRYFFAHRLGVRAGRGVWLGFTETGVYSGAGRGFEPALHAPLNLALLSEFNDNLKVNVLAGVDAYVRLGPRSSVSFSGFIDDIQIDRRTITDKRPASYGLSAVARSAMFARPWHAALGYTRISSLAYRNSDGPAAEYSQAGVGIGSNYSDYDQLLLRLETQRDGAWWLTFDISYTRQGSGDFRAPFPSDSVLAQPGQGFLVPPVEHLFGARATASLDVIRGVAFRGEVGLLRRPSGGVELILGLKGTTQLDILHRRLGAAFPAVAPGANRAWP